VLIFNNINKNIHYYKKLKKKNIIDILKEVLNLKNYNKIKKKILLILVI